MEESLIVDITDIDSPYPLRRNKEVVPPSFIIRRFLNDAGSIIGSEEVTLPPCCLVPLPNAR